MFSPLQTHLLLALDALLCLFCIAAAWGLFGDKSKRPSASDLGVSSVDEKVVGQACKVVQTAPLLVEIGNNCFNAYCKDNVVVGELLTVMQIHGKAVAVCRPLTPVGD